MVTRLLQYLTFKTTLEIKKDMRDKRRAKRRENEIKAERKRREEAEYRQFGGSEFFSKPR